MIANADEKVAGQIVHVINGVGWFVRSAGDDVMYGDEGNNTLDGDAGDDQLFGAGGSDTLYGGEGNDVIDGGDGDDYLLGGAGHDRLLGGQGDDWVMGGAGDDLIDGGDGDDILDDIEGRNVLRGGAGNDRIYGSGTMEGGQGDDLLIAGNPRSNDLYLFNRGDGRDTIVEFGADDESTEDALRFGPDITESQLWFSKQGEDLSINIVGSHEGVLIKDWYVSSAYRIESIQLAGGRALNLEGVEALVQAMATLAPPAAGESSLTPDYLAALAPVLAASWRAAA